MFVKFRFQYFYNIFNFSKENGLMFFVSSVIISKTKLLSTKSSLFTPEYEMFDKKFLGLILVLVYGFTFLLKCLALMLCCYF